VVASNADFADALAGGPLAFAKGAPLLITTPDALDPAVNTEIKRVLPPLGTVYVLGGTTAVSSSVDSTLTSDGFMVSRVAGLDRFETAVKIADQLKDPSTVFEVTGFNFADALSAGPIAAASGGVILLTNGAAQAAQTGTYVNAHPGTHYAIGGPAATADPAAKPIKGPDRYATAIAVARGFPAPKALGFATGARFADALTGGPAMGVAGGPILLVRPCGDLPSGLSDYIAAVKSSAKSGLLFGGPLSVGDDILTKLDAALA
jgi:putative cell wall-binding protein